MQTHISRVYDRVIFLDFDGVLNSEQTKPKGELSYGLHPELVERLNVLVETTHAAVVVSSSWRKGSRWEEALRTAGFTGTILGVTGSDPKGFRGEEVDAWLRDHGKDVRQYAILDDEHDFYRWQPLFSTSLHGGGLTWEVVRRVQAHFN